MNQTNPETEPSPVTEFLCFAVYSTHHAFSRAYKPLLDQLGLTYPQYLVMVLLWGSDGQSVGALGQKLFLESNTLTPLLKRLEASGHVTRVRASHDERQVLVHLTPKGRALRAEAGGIPHCVSEAMGLTAGQAARLRDELAGLRSRLLNAGDDGSKADPRAG